MRTCCMYSIPDIHDEGYRSGESFRRAGYFVFANLVLCCIDHIDLSQEFEKKNFNCGPGHRMPVLIKQDLNLDKDSQLVIRPLRWGLVPSFTKAESKKEACRAANLMINARSGCLIQMSELSIVKRIHQVG